MTSAHDPFSQSFDAIEVDPARAPSPQAIDHAFALFTPSAAAPDLASSGFFLVDDADGRFTIDREMGVVSLKDEAILERERFAIHAVRIRVVERTGASYELDLQLRLTGVVPQVVGAEDALFDIPADEAPQAAPAPVVVIAPAPAAPVTPTHWTKYAAAHARAGKLALARTRRAFISAEWPDITPHLADAALTIGTLPPIGLSNDWSL